MKQILLVLLVLTALMVGFFVQRKLTEPVRRTQPTTGPNNPGAVTPRPSAANPSPNPNRNPQRDRANQRRPSDRAVFVEWKGLASPDWVVPWNEVWELDFAQIDLDAEVPVVIGDLSITQADLRRMLCLEVAGHYHLARFSEAVARADAQRRGNRYELSNLLHEELLAHQAQMEGIPIEQKKAHLTQQVQLPPALSIETHRLLTAGLIYNAVGGEIEQLPIGLLDALRFVGARDAEGQLLLDGNNRPHAFLTVVELREAWNRLHSAEQYEERNFDLTKLTSITQVFSALQQGMRNTDLGVRCWTFLDAPMPDDVFMCVALGEVDYEADPVAPWLLGGDVAQIRVDEIWPHISGSLTRHARESSLRALVWFKYLEHRLDALDVLPAAEESFPRMIQRNLDLADTMLDLMFTIQAEGFPSAHHYRAAHRLFEGHRNLLPPGWNEEPVQRTFYMANKFFIERWNPEIEFAYFPALDWSETEDGKVEWKLDWDKALAEARAIKGKVALGQEFKDLVRSHSDALVARMGRYAGEEFANEYRKRVFGGAKMGTLRTVEETLGESDYVELLRGTSLVKVLAAYEDVGVVSEPLRIEGGYAVVRMARAELAALERDWEDSKPLCETHYLRSNFLLWANSELREAEKIYGG